MNEHEHHLEQPRLEVRENSLERKIQSALFQNDRLSSRPIEVKVTDTGVELSGTVQSHRRKEEAERTALSVCTEGAAPLPMVINQLKVELQEIQPDPELAETARETLEDTPGIAQSALIVKTRAGVAEARGSVRTPGERELVSDVLLAVPGIRGIRNYLLVEPDLAVRDNRDGEKISRWINSHSLLSGASIRVAVAEGRAFLSGKTKQLWQRSLAERAARRLCPDLIRIDNAIRITEAA